MIGGLVAKLCVILCNPMYHSLPGFPVHGILQARILEWDAISFSRGVFLTQGLNLGLLHCRWILYQLNHQGSPMIGDYDMLSFHKMMPLEKLGKGN